MLTISALVLAASSPAPSPESLVLTASPPTLLATLGSAAAAGVALALVWLGRVLRSRLQRVLDQTENEHADAEYPNMRDELTATRKAAESAVTAATTASESVTHLAKTVGEDRKASRAETEGVREDVRMLSQRLDLHIVETIRAQGSKT